MSTKEREWFDNELTLLKLEKEPFYDFFEMNVERNIRFPHWIVEVTIVLKQRPIVIF